jgi:optic atrophy 3 protein
LTNFKDQNRIKIQAHEHPKFRAIAAKYGQTIHQLNMRMSVSALRDVSAEKRAKERAEAPTVKTEEQTRSEDQAKEKATTKEKEVKPEASKSVWKRKFRPLPEAKAVDLFADVVGDAFVLAIAGALIIYEYVRSKQKPDTNAIRIAELDEQLRGEEKRIAELEELERQQQKRVEMLEEALETLRNPPKKKRTFSLS